MLLAPAQGNEDTLQHALKVALASAQGKEDASLAAMGDWNYFKPAGQALDTAQGKADVVTIATMNKEQIGLLVEERDQRSSARRRRIEREDLKVMQKLRAQQQEALAPAQGNL